MDAVYDRVDEFTLVYSSIVAIAPPFFFFFLDMSCHLDTSIMATPTKRRVRDDLPRDHGA